LLIHKKLSQICNALGYEGYDIELVTELCVQYEHLRDQALRGRESPNDESQRYVKRKRTDGQAPRLKRRANAKRHQDTSQLHTDQVPEINLDEDDEGLESSQFICYRPPKQCSSNSERATRDEVGFIPEAYQGILSLLYFNACQ